MNMKVMVAQINPAIGDLAGNLSLIQDSILTAGSAACDVVVFPELATVGYPPRDLLYSTAFWRSHAAVIDKLERFIKQQTHPITVIVGGLHEQMLSGGRYIRYNAAWILDQHFGRRVVHKRLLPCYDVFDETRYFSSGANSRHMPIPIHVVKRQNNRVTEYDVLCDVLICEDIWNHNFRGGEDWMKPATYVINPLEDIAGKGPLFVLNGSPFWIGKIEETQKLVESICDRIQQPVVWCNQIGAHDDIVTGGYSMVSIVNQTANGFPSPHPKVVTRRARAFQEDSMIVRFSDESTHHSNLNEGRDIQTPLVSHPTVSSGRHVADADFEMWTIYKALFLHMADYKRRCGFKKAVLGLSGGIDSAVVAVIAAHVFGSENVTGIGMPSPYSSEGSVVDAETLAMNLNISFELKKITEAYESIRNLFLTGGKQQFDNSVTDENIQPRVRGMILMAYSNEYDPCLLLTTGNKSEIAIGYCTIYGDMCGGLAVISDLWKTQVYRLARFINKYFGEPIPEGTISKPASAELKPNQQDTDSLPPYDLLDPLLRLLVEEEMSPMEIMQTQWFKTHIPGMDSGSVGKQHITTGIIKEMYRKYRIAEYKRQQMPPGPKIQRRSFGSGRRMPIAMKLTTV